MFGEYFDATQNFHEILHSKRKKSGEKDSSLVTEPKQSSLSAVDSCNGSPDILQIQNNASLESNSLQEPMAKPNFYHNGQNYTNQYHKKYPPTMSVSSSKCINGLRSISMLWIIFAHTLSSQSTMGFTNPGSFFPPNGVISTKFGYAILSARYAVDTFFYLSGYLVMSGLLKRLDPQLKKHNDGDSKEHACIQSWKHRLIQWGIINPNHKVVGDYGRKRLTENLSNGQSTLFSERKSFWNIKWILPFLLHRILRILPTYGFVLLLWWKIAITLGEGPSWPQWALFAQKCDQYAWTNMLFVNNLVPWYQPFGEVRDKSVDFSDFSYFLRN